MLLKGFVSSQSRPEKELDPRKHCCREAAHSAAECVSGAGLARSPCAQRLLCFQGPLSVRVVVPISPTQAWGALLCLSVPPQGRHPPLSLPRPVCAEPGCQSAGWEGDELLNEAVQGVWTSLLAQMYSVCLQCGRPGFDPWVRKIPWRRKWHPTPELLPGESHGWWSLVGYSPWGRKELDTTERLHFLSSRV